MLEGGGPGGGITPPLHGCCVQAPDYIWDLERGGVLEGGEVRGGGCPPPARLLCPSIRLYLGPSTRGRARGGGVRGGVRGGNRGGVYPPQARLLCPSIRLYLGPSMRGRARGGGPGGVSPPPGTAAVSKHQTISGTQHEGACSRGGVRGGFSPPSDTAAVLNSH